MLSGTATTNHHNRPRPPGGRRASSTKVAERGATATAIQAPEEAQPQGNFHEETPPVATTAQISPNVTTGRASTLAMTGTEMEKDLELDLPFDLTAALGSNHRVWPQTRKPTSSRHARDWSGEKESLHGDAGSNLGGSLGRALDLKVKRQQARAPPRLSRSQQRSQGKEALDSLFLPAKQDLADLGIDAVLTKGEERASRASLDSEAGSEPSLDSLWVGDLPREELEVLLMQANQVIKERERDLGIAAAIGKALLEKNISLRSKHEGIMSRLSSVSSFTHLHNNDEQSSLSHPRYSPPTTDIDVSTELDDETPRPTPKLSNGYFDGQSSQPASPRADLMAQQMPPASQEGRQTPNRNDHTRSWSAASNCYVDSAPASPAPLSTIGSQSRTLGQIHLTNETQRQLEMLSEQNEVLLEQLSLLQQEAEEAKKAGGKRLKKLNREIDGLRSELESATERNVELEMVAAVDDNGANKDVNAGCARQPWTRRGNQWRDDSDEAVASMRSSSTVRGQESREEELPNSQRASSDMGTSEVDAESISARSESSLSMASQKMTSEPERALVAQLLAKIRELEDTNALLALAGTEMDGRIGKAMEEGERIRDAYEAVESVAAMHSSMEGESTLRREDSGMLESICSGSPYSSANVSPSQRRRRAPGNRYIIEGRRTLRAALRSERDLHAGMDEYDYSSNNSSQNQSPVKSRGQRRALRPRILITPSCDDLQAKARDDGASEWDDIRSPFEDQAADVAEKASGQMASTPPKRRHNRRQQVGLRSRASVGEFSTLSSMSSLGNFHYQGKRSLGSELGSLFGGDDSPTKELARRPILDAPLRMTDLQRRSSVGSFNLRSRASITSLRAASEAESDIADLRWSVCSDATIQGGAVEKEEDGQSDAADETARQMALVTTSALHAGDKGDWQTANDEDILPKGSLRNGTESNHESYQWIERVTTKAPLHWADDDDFGKPITEKQARQLGLLESAANMPGAHRGLLGWVQGRKTGQGKGKARESTMIESRETMQEREELENLLREKRVVALRNRVISGQISMDRARVMGAVGDEEQEEDLSRAYDDHSLESEITARAFSYSTARQRRMQKQQQRQGRRPDNDEQNTKRNETAESDSSDEVFELLDLDPSKRRPGRRGTDYYPITLKDRYKPKVVKQRVRQVSNEAITWASTWATFSLVMVFAFLVAFSRGPKRVLNGQKK